MNYREEQKREMIQECNQALNESLIDAGEIEDDCHLLCKRYLKKKRTSRNREAIYGQPE